MLNNCTIAVVVPAFNEEKQIGAVIETMPDFVDKIIIVNDCSVDKTEEIVKSFWGEKSNKGITTPDITKAVISGRFERANLVLQSRMKTELELFPSSHIANSDADSERIVLINMNRMVHIMMWYTIKRIILIFVIIIDIIPRHD